MKTKYLVIVALLLAILTIGAVSASEATDDLAVNDDGVDIKEAPVNDGASAGDAIGTYYDGEGGFDADVEDEVHLEDTDSVVDVLAPEAGNISISISKNESSLPDVTREVSEADVSDDEISFYLNDLGISEAGTYLLSAKFINSSGIEKPYFVNHELTVLEKEKYDLDYSFDVNNFILTGSDSTMRLYLSNLVSGNFTIVLDGETTLVNEKVGYYYAEWKIEDFSISKGRHYVQLVYEGDEEYNAFESDKYYFIYDDVIINIPDKVVIGGYDYLIVHLKDDKGYLDVFIDGKEFLSDAVANLLDDSYEGYRIDIDLGKLSLGNHTYNVTYTNGDNKVSVNGSFEVDFIFKVESERYEQGEPVYFGRDTYFDVWLPDGATGTISVVVAGENLTFNYESQEYLIISNLELGWNYLNFTYSGDAIWPKKSYLYEIQTSSIINFPNEFIYGDDGFIELVLPANATGNLTVQIFDGGYNLFKTVELKNGKASISPWDLGLGQYNFYAFYTGDDYDVNEGYYYVKLLPKVTYNRYVFRNATSTITVESPKDVKGNFTITLYSEGVYDENVVMYNASAKDIITLTFPKLNDTSYGIKIEFTGINASFEDYYYLHVMDAPSTWDMNAKFINEVNMYDAYDIEDAWSVNIPKEMYYGDIYIYVDGECVREREIMNYERESLITGNLDLIDLALGTHTWKIVVVPTAYFENQTAEGTFEVTWIIVPEEIYGDEVIFFDMEDENATGTLSMLIDGKDYAAEFVRNGVAIIELKNLTLGEHSYEITYSGDKNHPKLTKTGKFTVSQIFEFANIENGDVMPLYTVYPILINLDEDATGTVTATIGNITKKAAVVDGCVEFNFTGLDEGNYTITARYSGDSKYSAREISCNFTIKGYQVNIEGEEDSAFFSLVLPGDATGNLTVKLIIYDYDIEYIDLKTVELKDGQAVIKISDLNLTYGYFRLYAVYVGNYSEVTPAYLSFNRLPEVNITDKLIIGENANIKIDLGNGTGNIIIYLNEKIFDTVELKDGKLDFNISSVNLTTYNEIYFRYIGDNFDNHLFDEYDSELDIYSPKIFTVFVQIKNLTIPSTLAGGNGNITMELPENYAGNVSVYVDGKKASTTPVKGGKVTIPISNLKTGENDVRVEINGNDGSKYYARSTVDVPKPEPSVNIVTPKDSKTPQFTVNLPSDATGTLIVNIGGKNYVADLINGSATIAPTGLADGTYNATIKYSGDANYREFEKTQNVTIKTAVDAKIVADDLTVIYSSNGLYSVVVYGTDGNVAANTEVTFLINGKVYKIVKTNEKGVASIAITQKPGTYKITAKALDINVTKKLTVKHILKLKKVKVKRFAKKLVIKATLAKVNGKYLKNKKVTLKFKGKKYTAKTNKKGVAKFTIKSKVLKKLKAGKKVTYQATYLKDTVKRTVKVKK